MRAIGLLFCASLVACSPAVDELAGSGELAKTQTVRAQPAEVMSGVDEPLTGFDSYALDENGIVLRNSAEGISFTFAFGALQSDVETAMADLTDLQSTVSSAEECPAGPMDFSSYGALMLNYQDGYFAGWSMFAADEAEQAPSTVDGISIGSTRAQVEQSRDLLEFEDSSLGYEFDAGGLQMLLSGTGPDARVENMWAGTNCIFR